MDDTFDSVSLADLAALPSDQTLVLTVNNRLARRIVGALSGGLDEQRSVAAIPDIAPLSAWLRQVADLLAFDPQAQSAAHVLDAFGARQLWRQVILAEEADHALLDAAQAARLAYEADRLMSDWRIVVDAGQETPEYLRFKAWRKRYRERLARLDAEDENLAYERIAQALPAGRVQWPLHTLVLAGFNEFSPRLAALLRGLREQGVVLLRLHESRQAAAEIERVLADEPDAEWRLAAQWAADCLSRDPRGRYAIVSSRLQADAALAHRVLRAELARDGAGAVMPYNVAVGRPLRDWPVAHAALAWLEVLGAYARGADCRPQQLGQALLAGHCAGDSTESPARAALDARWRRRRRLAMGAAGFGNELAQWAPRLGQAWGAALDMAAASLGAADCNVWVRRFRQLLDALGFPGDGALDSHAYQAMEALDAAFDRLAGQSVALGPQDFPSALGLLGQLLAEVSFQPQRDPDARLDVLGFLEAEGGRWDGAWVLGLDDEVLPAAARPNPLIPLAALRRAGAPRATPERELQWAGDLYAALLCSAQRVRISHAERDGERELRPSPFIAELPVRPEAVRQSSFEPAEMEGLVDDRGPQLTAAGATPGGIALMDTQARNPLWAFVKYRLGAVRLDGYAELADLNVRGVFLHRALEVAWGSMGSHAVLQKLDQDGGLAVLVEESVRQAAQDCLRDYGSVLRSLEIERARKVLRDWLGLELQRRPFQVRGREDARTWSYETLELALRLDRVDQLEDGSLMIIDYKSGSARIDPKASWMRPRPVDLQLPFYAAVIAGGGERVAALALVRLHAREVEARGLCEGDCGLPGLDAVQDWPAYAGYTWDALIQEWRRAMERLAQEYVAGVACNEVVRKDDIKYCDVLPFLRLEEEPAHAGPHA